jgi:heterodisulfide reductase subunit A2
VVAKPVVIAGGGIAGLAVAKVLSDSGVASVVAERSQHLGGNVRNWACMATDRCMRCFCCLVEDFVEDIRVSDKVAVRTGWELSSVSFDNAEARQVCLREVSTGTEVTVEASALVLATGFEPYNPSEKVLWGHGRIEGVYTLAEVDALLRQDRLSQFTRGRSGLRVAFFQCVGSRDVASGANYCSQYCCKAALRMALKLTHECEDLCVTVFYIDLQVAGKYAGDLLRELELQSVRLCQGVPGEIVEGDRGLLEMVVEQQGRNTKEYFDRVILSIGQRFPGSVAELSFQAGLARNDFGFLQVQSLLDDSRTAIPGMYVAGTCSGPKDIERTLEHAGTTAAAVLADLPGGGVRHHE